MRLIDADELLNEVRYLDLEDCDDYGKIKEMILDAPTVEAEPIKHGHWDYARNGCHKGLQCSACNRYSKNLSPFCQWCGAKMDEEINNEKTL